MRRVSTVSGVRYVTRHCARIGGSVFGRSLIGSVLGPREKNDLEKYLLIAQHVAQEPMNTDVLAWWKLRDHNKPADPSTGRVEGLPHLARMARQWLGCPATSAGVERLFSKAGSMHHDLKGSMEDGSLEHSLIATANSE